ncbi:helicase-related protein [Actinoplanes sp. DH11]|uniref:helicase-related protein n=1 Tax=Actinoplanes sp. DH11 TaxID=2857011 RepID=UPI001E51FACE|nr:helicase-related protein [Actinoplanes sp. DH11]
MEDVRSGAKLDVAPGSVVVIRDEEWLVDAVEETADGPLVRVRGLSELVRDTTASFFDSLDDIEPLDPASADVVADDSPQYRKARLWLESTFRKTAVPLGDRSLAVSTQALAMPLSYQQTAVRKALDPDNLRPRILLADAVGLGKTLEIGMILSELVRRGRGDRILIVTPRHVLEQMQQELWSRFALPFVRLDSAGIQRVRQKLPANRNPFTYFRRAIISIDTLKSERYVASLRKQRWDAVVIDESHNLANASTQNNKLARLLSRNTEALILASATPHNGRADSFAELVRLLDPSAIPPSGDLVPAEVERLVIRRHRHSPEVAGAVGADWAERLEPENILIPATPAENAVAHELDSVWLWPEGHRTPYSGQNASLFPWTLAKAFLSSPAALAETIRQRIDRLGKDAAGETERAALERLAALNEEVGAQGSAKFARLLEQLKTMGVAAGSPKRVVVFAERVATLTALHKQLPKALGMPPGAVEMLHGGLPDDEQQRIVDAFKQEQTPVRVLVTGDVASEGVNLHAQCHELIHFDIPWSLIRIEQRNGRIDRYGQKFPPRITALLLEPTSENFAGDIRVLAKLVEKENEAHRALGDVASLMGKYDVKGEEEAIRAVLAGQRKLDEVVRAPDDVLDGDDLTAMFLSYEGGEDSEDEPAAPETETAGSGLYPDDISYLDEALHAAFIDPTKPLSNNGVSWRRNAAFGTAELTPPPDLAQRLDVLPQSYLADRRVIEKLVLATTFARGQDRLSEALRDDNGSSWPDAHFLSPLHPVLDWASDRALAGLGRNQVFAVRGDMEDLTVLLLGTLTNRRGQVVSATWLTAAFPMPDDLSFALMEVHQSAAAALAHLGWNTTRANPGPVPHAATLRAFIEPAVERSRAQMRGVFTAAEKDVAERIEQWSGRLSAWQQAADKQAQRPDLKQRRVSIEQEQKLVAEMNPDRQLVRPLLVVTPTTGVQA